jgi:hypothetical protein
MTIAVIAVGCAIVGVGIVLIPDLSVASFPLLLTAIVFGIIVLLSRNKRAKPLAVAAIAVAVVGGIAVWGYFVIMFVLIVTADMRV